MIALRCSGFDRVDLEKAKELGIKVLLHKKASVLLLFFWFKNKEDQDECSCCLHGSLLYIFDKIIQRACFLHSLSSAGGTSTKVFSLRCI